MRRIRRTRSGIHRVFVIATAPDAHVEIDANLDVMGDFPIRRGETAIVHGEYYADPSGRDGIHWTHRTDRGNHPPGYVILDGRTYQ